MIRIKRKEDFEKYFDENKYQVFLFLQHLGVSYHSWIVLNEKGKFSRIEVITKNYWKTHSHISLRENRITRAVKDPWGKLAFIKIIYLRDLCEGKVAKEIIGFLKSKLGEYKFRKRYFLFGPNCNTFTQAIINKFPESGFKLPWNAFGKGYANKNSFD